MTKSKNNKRKEKRWIRRIGDKNVRNGNKKIK